MNLRKYARLSFVASLFLSNLPIFGALTAAPLTTPQEESLKLLKNGEESSLSLYRLNDTPYLTVEQLAQLSGAQLRWQAVTQQACLSNSEGVLCFNWDRHHVEKNNRVVKTNMGMHFDNNQLFIPISFTTSKDFQSFADSDFSWDPSEKKFIQTAGVVLGTPEVERMKGRYQMRVATPEKSQQYLIDQSNKRVWVRFVRAHSTGSQVFEGDDVIKSVKLVQKRRSADLILSLGNQAFNSEVYFDDAKKELVIDVFTRDADILAMETKPHKRGTAIPIKRSPAAAVVSLPTTETNRMRTPPVRKSNNRDTITIVIDAGHGGMDAGAIGPRGTLEKDINLEVARALAKQLKKEKNIQVIMTRDNDEFVPLSQRTDIANASNADLFVSVHCNSSLSSKSMGFETYFLSPDASDKAAEAVARIENSVVSLETKKGTGSSKLESLLASMAVHDQINESSRFASLLVRSVKELSGVDRAAVKEADFYVLRGAQMPAVLIELEYLSHPISEVKLRSSRFRGNLVKGLIEGILTFDKHLKQEKDKLSVLATQPSNKTER